LRKAAPHSTGKKEGCYNPFHIALIVVVRYGVLAKNKNCSTGMRGTLRKFLLHT
jgi:hypothetical protein